MSDKPSRSTLRLPRKHSSAQREDNPTTPDTSSKTGSRARRARRQQHEQYKQQRQQQPRSTRPRRDRTTNPRKDTTFTVFVSCPRGLESVLAQQLQALGLHN